MTLQVKLSAVCLDHTVVLCSDKMRVYLLSESWLDGTIWLGHEFLFVVHFHMKKKQLNIWCWAFFIIFDPSQLCSYVYGQLWPAVLWSIPFESRNIMLNAGVWKKCGIRIVVSVHFQNWPQLRWPVLFSFFMSSKPSHILLFCCWFIATRLQFTNKSIILLLQLNISLYIERRLSFRQLSMHR